MRPLFISTMLLLLLAASSGCGPRDPLKGIRDAYPRADEYLAWKDYALVRFPIEAVDPDLRPAILFRREAGEWLELGRSNEGFLSLHEVITYIPELDESGVAAFDLR
jgi:hypothetical protein